MNSIHEADLIVAKYQIQKALNFAIQQSNKRCFREWVIKCASMARIRTFGMKKLQKMRRIMFKFWFTISQKQVLRRRRRLLAEVIGLYTLKARVFARIKLFNYNARRINAIAAKYDKPVKFLHQALSHLRIFIRLSDLKLFMKQWKDFSRSVRNNEAWKFFYFKKTTSKIIREWGSIAHAAAHTKRMEILVLENQRHFITMMKEAEDDAKLLDGTFKNLIYFVF